MSLRSRLEVAGLIGPYKDQLQLTSGQCVECGECQHIASKSGRKPSCIVCGGWIDETRSASR